MLVPVDLGLGRGEVVVERRARAGRLVDVGGKLGADRVVDTIEPDEEQAARHAAGVPIALFLKAADLARKPMLC